MEIHINLSHIIHFTSNRTQGFPFQVACITMQPSWWSLGLIHVVVWRGPPFASTWKGLVLSPDHTSLLCKENGSGVNRAYSLAFSRNLWRPIRFQPSQLFMWQMNNNRIELLQAFMYAFVVYHQKSDWQGNPCRDSMDSQALKVQQSNGVSAEGYKRVCGGERRICSSSNREHKVSLLCT